MSKQKNKRKRTNNKKVFNFKVHDEGTWSKWQCGNETETSNKDQKFEWSKLAVTREGYSRINKNHREKYKSFVNNLYIVTTNNMPPVSGLGEMTLLAIGRTDFDAIHDWQHFQRIKNELIGPECEAVELYPKESRLMDTGNRYHLNVLCDPNCTFSLFNDFNIIMMQNKQTIEPKYCINDMYEVYVFKMQPVPIFGEMLGLSIGRKDFKPINDWRHIQRIKNELVGPEYEALELYPKESKRKLTHVKNNTHLCVLNHQNSKFPFGQDSGRVLLEDSPTGRQRLFGEDIKPNDIMAKEQYLKLLSEMEETIEIRKSIPLPSEIKDIVSHLTTISLEQPRQVIKPLEELLNKYPKVPQLYELLGKIYTQLNDFKTVMQIRTRYYNEIPEYFPAMINYANLCLTCGNLNEIPSIFKNKLEANAWFSDQEDSYFIHFMSIIIEYFYKSGQFSLAQQHFETLQQLYPNHEITHMLKKMIEPSFLKSIFQRLKKK